MHCVLSRCFANFFIDHRFELNFWHISWDYIHLIETKTTVCLLHEIIHRNAIRHRRRWSPLARVIASCRFCTKPTPKLVMSFLWLHHKNLIWTKFELKCFSLSIYSKNLPLKCQKFLRVSIELSKIILGSCRFIKLCLSYLGLIRRNP